LTSAVVGVAMAITYLLSLKFLGVAEVDEVLARVKARAGRK